MSDLDEAKMLLEKIAYANQTKLGTTNVTCVTLALALLLRTTSSALQGHWRM